MLMTFTAGIEASARGRKTRYGVFKTPYDMIRTDGTVYNGGTANPQIEDPWLTN